MNKNNNIADKKIFNWRINIEIENGYNCSGELREKELIRSVSKYKSSIVIAL